MKGKYICSQSSSPCFLLLADKCKYSRPVLNKEGLSNPCTYAKGSRRAIKEYLIVDG